MLFVRFHCVFVRSTLCAAEKWPLGGGGGVTTNNNRPPNWFSSLHTHWPPNSFPIESHSSCVCSTTPQSTTTSCFIVGPFFGSAGSPSLFFFFFLSLSPRFYVNYGPAARFDSVNVREDKGLSFISIIPKARTTTTTNEQGRGTRLRPAQGLQKGPQEYGGFEAGIQMP